MYVCFKYDQISLDEVEAASADKFVRPSTYDRPSDGHTGSTWSYTSMEKNVCIRIRLCKSFKKGKHCCDPFAYQQTVVNFSGF